MRNHWWHQILRLISSALFSHFARSATAQNRLRRYDRRCLRRCFTRSPYRPTCKSVPQVCLGNSSPSHLVVALSPGPVPKICFVGVRFFFPSQIPRTNLASARPCLTSLRTFPVGDTAKRKSAASANFKISPWYGFPKQSSNAVFLFPFTWYLSSNHPACRTSHGQVSMGCVFCRETCFEFESQAPDLSFHSTASCARPDALAAASRCCFDLQLDVFCAGSQRDLVSQCLQRWFGIHLRTAFAYAMRLTNAVHNAERYAFSPDFVAHRILGR